MTTDDKELTIEELLGIDAGEFPRDFIDPIANPLLPITVADPEDYEGLHPPEERLAAEPLVVESVRSPQGRLSLAPCAIPGINLRDYSRTPQGRGAGNPCTVTLATVQLLEARFAVDVRLAELVWLIMAANEKQGYIYRKADTGAYNCRKIGGSTAWSWHAWAWAIDANWQTNPYTSPLHTDRPQWERDRWNRYGFAGGWDYTGDKDAMHSEYMGVVAQIGLSLDLARRELLPIIHGVGPIPVPIQPWLALPAVRSRALSFQRWYNAYPFRPALLPIIKPLANNFGPQSVTALKKVQARYGLVPDAIDGPLTKRLLWDLGWRG